MKPDFLQEMIDESTAQDPKFPSLVAKAQSRRRKRVRIIDRLRQQFPGEWAYNARDNTWEYEGGWHVRAYAQLAGEDDFVTVYRRSDTDEVVYGLLDLAF